nr:MAG TPA: hypothetical protein [Caudoviricetes sp.]DAX38075.1 MAG TPA: hypothetical protein [Caudoviricetes sp.]
MVGELFKCFISYTIILFQRINNASFYLCFYLTK